MKLRDFLKWYLTGVAVTLGVLSVSLLASLLYLALGV